MHTSITALFVDDHIAIRDSHRLLLRQYDIEVIGEADRGEQAIELYSQLQPDIVIMDLSIKGMNGLDCTARLIQRYPDAKIIIFSMHDNINFAIRSIRHGAMAYVLKSDHSSVLIDAIKQVYYQSKSFLSDELANGIALQNSRVDTDNLSCLSDREYSIFLLLIEGKSRHEIANTLSLTMGTISNNKTKILQKLQASSVSDLITIAVDANILKQNRLDRPL